jgi:hypothetical protein
MTALQRREVNCSRLYSSVFDPFEKIDDSHTKRLRQKVQTGKSQVHFAPFECSHLRTMKTTPIRKHVLTPALLQP